MKTKLLLKNSVLIFIFYIFNILINFISRKFFLENIGVEYLGVIGVYSNILTLLSISDLGVVSAITYQLYKPVQENDLPRIRYLISKFDKYYKRIAIVIFIIGVLFTIPLPLFIKDSSITITNLRLFFILQLFSTITSYLFASRKTLLFVYEKHYITVFFETISNIIFSVIRIVVILYTKNYLLFLLINILQIASSSIFVYFYSKHSFPFLSEKANDSYDFSISLFKDMKIMTISSIASFIYTSTDNLIISSIIGISSVGLLSNYKLIPQVLFDVIANVLKPVQARIGSLVHGNDTESNQLNTFKIDTFLRFIIANYVCISILLFTNDFILIWFGSEYILSDLTTILIVIDLFISIIQAPIVSFSMAKGYFKQERNILVLGAIINLSLSLILVKFLGINGVLIGTVLAQLFHWTSRIFMINSNLFHNLKEHLISSIDYILINLILSFVIFKLKDIFISIHSIYYLIFNGVIFTLFINILTVLITCRKNEFVQIIKSIKSLRKSNQV